MDKMFIKKIFVVIIIFSFLFPGLASAGLLQGEAIGDLAEHSSAFTETSKYDKSASLGNLTRVVIEGFLSLLAIIFIILIIIGGYGWMLAGGDEAKVTKAKDTIRRAIIGLIITVSAYAITYFVFNALPWGG